MVSAPSIVMARLLEASWFNSLEIITPNILIYLTAFTTWLSSRQLLLVLNWMQAAYKESRSLLEQPRDEHAALIRTVKSLEEAYRRIESMNYALIEARSAAEEARQGREFQPETQPDRDGHTRQ